MYVEFTHHMVPAMELTGLLRSFHVVDHRCILLNCAYGSELLSEGACLVNALPSNVAHATMIEI